MSTSTPGSDCMNAAQLRRTGHIVGVLNAQATGAVEHDEKVVLTVTFLDRNGYEFSVLMDDEGDVIGLETRKAVERFDTLRGVPEASWLDLQDSPLWDRVIA